MISKKKGSRNRKLYAGGKLKYSIFNNDLLEKVEEFFQDNDEYPFNSKKPNTKLFREFIWKKKSDYLTEETKGKIFIYFLQKNMADKTFVIFEDSDYTSEEKIYVLFKTGNETIILSLILKDKQWYLENTIKKSDKYTDKHKKWTFNIKYKNKFLKNNVKKYLNDDNKKIFSSLEDKIDSNNSNSNSNSNNHESNAPEENAKKTKKTKRKTKRKTKKLRNKDFLVKKQCLIKLVCNRKENLYGIIKSIFEKSGYKLIKKQDLIHFFKTVLDKKDFDEIELK